MTIITLTSPSHQISHAKHTASREGQVRAVNTVSGQAGSRWREASYKSCHVARLSGPQCSPIRAVISFSKLLEM